MKAFLLIFVLSLLVCGSGCKTQKESNFHVNQFSGKLLDGSEIRFSELLLFRVALNVYSPTCIPCFKEIPTLNYLREMMKTEKWGEFYMVVDPYNIVEDSDGKSFEEIYPEAVGLMNLEREKRNIQMPIVIMKPPFAVTPGEGMITGTPETLLFKTNPLSLYYNFIGSISEKENVLEISQDPKVLFFQKMVKNQ